MSESQDRNVVWQGMGMWLVRLERQRLRALYSMEFELHAESSGCAAGIDCLSEAGFPRADCIHFLGLPHIVLQTRGLQQQTCVLSQFWRLTSETSVSADWFLLEAWREHFFHGCPCSGDSLCCSLACRCITPISASVVTWHSSLCLCVASSKDTSHIGFRVHSNSV